MTAKLEDQLTTMMQDEVAGLTFTRDILADAARRHHRRVVLHRTAYAVGAIGVAGALAATLTIGSGSRNTGSTPPGPIAGGPTATAPASPQLRLAAAAAASQNISYHLKVTTTYLNELPPKGELPEPVSRTWTTTGAFDPVTLTGYLDSPSTGLRPVVAAGFEHERLINGVHYIGGRDARHPDDAKKIFWSRRPGTQDHLDFDLALGGGLTMTTDPQALFRTMQEAGAIVTEKAVGVYHFELTVPGDGRGLISDKFVGDVRVNADHRIASVTYDRAVQRVDEQGKPPFTYRLHVVTELSAYGTPVNVAVPQHLVG
ncbi:MAG: hypothetical protein HOV77_21590 [Hamadaea sp.]|uniref:hypothetical protein n=1 Tax=Hamadaea sp. TaxID=2024425 RepID=UPI0018230912|nr:hypothetical protein [Hamadaea sp.]NUT21776.1 hypothetical protein [Hamadaea sp.]